MLIKTRVQVTETEVLIYYPFAVRRVPTGHIDSVSIRAGHLVIETRTHQVIKPATFREQANDLKTSLGVNPDEHILL